LALRYPARRNCIREDPRLKSWAKPLERELIAAQDRAEAVATTFLR
jgi:hypothetical protein